MSTLEGVTIKKYKIVREVGQGGMGIVYQAKDAELPRHVAIKMISCENASQDQIASLLSRLRRETRALAQLTHPNIVKVLDFGEYEGLPYLIMEYMSGGSLRSRMGARILYAQAATQLVPIARALHHAHQKGIIHRDVKPANILINDSQQLMLSDFGIIKFVELEESQDLTGEMRWIGTRAYVSPEQYGNKAVDGRADMYSLGLVFFQMITGLDDERLLRQRLSQPVPKAKDFVHNLPPEVDKVISTALALNRDDRYRDMNAFAAALENLADTYTNSTADEPKPLNRSMSKAPRLAKPASKTHRKLPVQILSSLAIILVVLATTLLRFNLAPATNTPTPTLLTTPSPAKLYTPTLKPTHTPAPTVSLTSEITSAPSITRIAPDNAAMLIEVGRKDKVSVIGMDWIEYRNYLIDIGSGNNATVSLIDAPTVAIIQKINLPNDKVPLSMAVSPKTNRLYILFNDNIKVVDLEKLKVVNTFKPLTGGARSLAVSPDGVLLALGISNSKTQILNANDGGVIREIKSDYGGWSVGFSPDFKYVVSGTSQGILRWETDGWTWLPTNGGHDKTIKSLAFSHDSKLVAGGGNGVIFIWSMNDGELLQPIKGNFGTINSLDFSPDDTLLVSGSDDGYVRVWNAISGTLLKTLTGHTSKVFAVCFSPDGQNIASGANEGSIRIWGLP